MLAKNPGLTEQRRGAAIIKAEDLSAISAARTSTGDIARPWGRESRLRAAWLVLTGRADVVVFTAPSPAP